MMLIAVCSLKGSPGVTTFAAALGACRWPAGMRVVVVEADPSGGDLAARLELQLSPGLVSLAAASRRPAPPSDARRSSVLWAHTQKLSGGLTILPAPPGADQAQAALTVLLNDNADLLRRTAADPNVVVIADCGRIDPVAATQPLLRAADEVLLLTRAYVDDLVHLASRFDSIAADVRHIGLLMVGPGCSPTEVIRELSIPVVATVPYDRRTAAALCGRAWVRRGLTRSTLGRAAAEVATTVLGCHRSFNEHTNPQTDWTFNVGYGPDRLTASRSTTHDNGSTA